MKLRLLLFFLISLLFSCKGLNNEPNKTPSNKQKKKTNKKLLIIVQPFEGIPISTANLVAAHVRDFYSVNVVVHHSIALPKNALNQDKKRYRADSLIRYLGGLVKDGQLIIGLTNKDISSVKGKDPDYGVMGLGFCPGKSCIASTSRLKGKNRLEKLFKVAIHELAHTQGLAQTKTKHCPDKNCLMSDAKGKDRLDELSDFCSKCKPVLIKAGWQLQ